MKVISTRTHGILDYMTAAALFALPRMLNWGDRITSLLTSLAVVTVLYSLLTRYELGVFRAIPMKAHLGLDYMSGMLLLAAAVLLRDQPDGVRWALGLLGLWEIGAAVMTDTLPSRAVEATAGTRARGV